MFASLNLRPQERRPVLLLFIYSFATGSASIFSYTAAYSLFLSVFEESDLSYVFIVAAFLSLFIGTGFARLEQVLATERLFKLTVAFMFVSTVVIQIALWMDAGPWVYWAILVWYRLYFPITNLSFWGVIGRVLDVQQGKRLFGFVATGEDIARIIGYGTIPLVVTFVGAENLMLLNAIAVAFMFVSLSTLSPYISSVDAEEAQERDTLIELLALFVQLFRNQYIRNIFIVTFFGILAYFVIDFGLYSVVRVQFPTSDTLAQFLGYFWMSVYIFSLIFRFFFTNSILRRWGLSVGLLFLPAVFGLCSILVASSTIFAPSTIFVLIAVCSVKFFEDALSNTINRSSTTLLYQPLPAKTTLSAQVIAESLVAPVGLGVAGVLLLIFDTFPFFNLMWLSGLLIIIAICRIYFAREVFVNYVAALNRALSTRRLQGSLSDLDDSASIAVLESHLESDNPATLIYTLDLLGKVAPDHLQHHLKRFLLHENDHVARMAVQSVGRLKLRDALPQVEELAARQSPVSPEALYTMLALEKDNAAEIAINYLESEDLDLVGQSITGLIQFGSYENKGIANQKLQQFATSDKTEERVEAAAICGRLIGDEIDTMLETLLFDQSPTVQKQAVQSLIDNPHVFSLESDLKRFENREDIFEMIVSAMRLSGEDKVIDELLPYLNHHVISSRTEVYHALNTHGYIALNQQGRDNVEKEIDRELQLAHWISAGLADLSKESEGGLLQRALGEMLQDVRRRLFMLLSFVYDKNLINRIQSDLAKGEDSRQQALVLEALSNHLSTHHWEKAGPILQEDNPKDVWNRIRSKSTEPRLSYIKRVEAIIMTPDVAEMRTSEWLRVTALFDLGSKRLSDLKDVVAFCAVHDDKLIRETAEWALEKLEAPA